MSQLNPAPQELSHDQLQAQCFLWHWTEYPEQRGLMHANNNNSRNKIEGNQKKALGVVKGVLDLEYFYASKLYFFDIKIGRDKLSDDQLAFIAKVESEGAKCYEIRSLEQFQEFIKSVQNPQ